MARHTFGTMSLSAGIPIESIAKMMGHASISSTQIYAQVTDNKISEDMDRLIAKQSAKDKETMEREENDHSAATPCIIVLYKLSSFLCSQIVATTEYFESTRGYCCLKHALVFLGFKSTKNMNMLQIFDRKCFIDSLATIFSARCKPIYINRSCTLHLMDLNLIFLYR